MNAALDEFLQRHPQVWRGRRAAWADADTIATGFADLDVHLPGGGWPRGALTEVLLPRPGIGELRLLLPALARVQQEKKWIALIAPPHVPYAPAWQAAGVDLSRLLWVHTRSPIDLLWALEQALRAGTCGAVLGWPTSVPRFEQLRRLQLAAESGLSWGILFRPEAEARQASPAAVRVRLEARDHHLAAHLLKRRGACSGESLQLSLPLFTVIK